MMDEVKINTDPVEVQNQQEMALKTGVVDTIKPNDEGGQNTKTTRLAQKIMNYRAVDAAVHNRIKQLGGKQ